MEVIKNKSTRFKVRSYLWGGEAPSFGPNGGLTTANGAAGSLGCERERRREKERREEEERAARRFKPLSHAKRIDATQPTSTHTSYGI
jgi:hypothetical protein